MVPAVLHDPLLARDATPQKARIIWGYVGTWLCAIA